MLVAVLVVAVVVFVVAMLLDDCKLAARVGRPKMQQCLHAAFRGSCRCDF